MERISESFEHELEALRQRLEEAEDVRRAITRGEVDAFVVAPGGNNRVLLLANAYQRYRQLVERMQQGAITASPNGQILFANQRFADMIAVPLAQLYTAPLESYVKLGDRARLSTFLMMTTRDARVDIELERRDGAPIPARLSIASFADAMAVPGGRCPRLDPQLAREVEPPRHRRRGARCAARHQRGNQRLGAHDRRDARRRVDEPAAQVGG